MKHISDLVITDIASDFIEGEQNGVATITIESLIEFAREIQKESEEENDPRQEDDDPSVVRTITKDDAFEAAELYGENHRILVVMGIITNQEDHVITINGVKEMNGYEERIKLPVKLLMGMLQIQLETNNNRIKQLVPQGYTPWIPVNDENGNQS